MGVIDLDARVKKLEAGESGGVDPDVIDQLEAAVTDLEETVNGDGETDFGLVGDVAALETTVNGDGDTNLGLVGDVAALQSEIENLPVGINYSTTEKEVGTWTDGKKVYQRTYVAQTISANTAETLFLDMSTIGATKLINAFGMIYKLDSGGNYYYAIGSYVSSVIHSGVYINTSNILCITHESTNRSQTFDLTIQYLKN